LQLTQANEVGSRIEEESRMRLFECQHCGQMLYFENTRCEKCGHALGYLPERVVLSALVQRDVDLWSPLADPERISRFCANAQHDACNWLVPAEAMDTLCQACRLNRTIPNLSVAEHLPLWQRLEVAKRRMVYGLLRLGLPIVDKAQDPERGLAFDFLADPDPTLRESPQVMTGHAEGLITINIAEADDAERERRRQDMAEPYRTLLGHFRHEIGHYYWERLVRNGPWLEPFRALFADERQDYGSCLQAHHAAGPPADWPARFISGYAAAHPWEDWAETWAHYLHLVDTLETAQAFNLRLRPEAGRDPALAVAASFDPYRHGDFGAMIATWLPLTYAVNSLNRSMGQPDLYPFVLAPAVVEKLRFVHDLVMTEGGTG
jgi:hypothetical protein